MNFDKPSPFEKVHAPKFSHVLPILFFSGLELAMWVMFFCLYTAGMNLMDGTYLSELPIIGAVFMYIDPDANASHIIALLLATFSVGTPLFIWAEIFRQNILDNPREWISHPQNQIITGLAALVLLLVIGLECTNLYSLIAKKEMHALNGVFLQDKEAGLMEFLAQNKRMAIATSIVIAVINIILGLFTTRAFILLNASKEGNS